MFWCKVGLALRMASQLAASTLHRRCGCSGEGRQQEWSGGAPQLFETPPPMALSQPQPGQGAQAHGAAAAATAADAAFAVASQQHANQQALAGQLAEAAAAVGGFPPPLLPQTLQPFRYVRGD